MSVGSPLLNVAPPILATLNGVRAIEIILREVSSIGGLPRSEMDQPDGRRVARPAKPDSPGPAVHAYTMTIANGKRHSNRQDTCVQVVAFGSTGADRIMSGHRSCE